MNVLPSSRNKISPVEAADERKIRRIEKIEHANLLSGPANLNHSAVKPRMRRTVTPLLQYGGFPLRSIYYYLKASVDIYKLFFCGLVLVKKKKTNEQ